METVSVAVDISRASVKAVAFSFDKNAKSAGLIDHQKLALPPTGDKLDGFLRALATLRVFIEGVIKEHRVRISDISVSVPSALLLSEVREFRFVRPSPETSLSDGELTGLWRLVRDQAAEALLPQGAAEDSYSIFIPEAERVTIDGYPLSGDRRGTGREIIISALVSAWSEDFAGVADGLRANFPSADISFAPEAVLISDYIHLRRGATVSGVVVDIGARDSTLLLFDHGVLEDLWALPFGGEDISKAIAKELSITLVDAEQKKRQWIRGSIDAPVAKRIGHAASRVTDFWKREWGSILASRAATAVVLPHVYLLGMGALLPGLAEALSELEWLESFSAGAAGDVSLLLPGDEEKEFFPGWPFEDSGDAVLFSLVSRMIHKRT